MTIKYSHNPRRKHSRFSVIVSKKVLKSAVGRNRIRRRLYELLRHQLDEIKDSHDIACIVTSRELRQMDSTELQAIVTAIIKDAGLYK